MTLKSINVFSFHVLNLLYVETLSYGELRTLTAFIT